jgi:hypothetical protein
MLRTLRTFISQLDLNYHGQNFYVENFKNIYITDIYKYYSHFLRNPTLFQQTFYRALNLCRFLAICVTYRL